MIEGRFRALGAKIGQLVEEKNKAYGNSFGLSGSVLKLLYPNGVKPEQYGDLLAIVRVIDKLFRVATSKRAFGESPWEDVAGYGIVAAVKDSMEAEKEALRNLKVVDPTPPSERITVMEPEAHIF